MILHIYIFKVFLRKKSYKKYKKVVVNKYPKLKPVKKRVKSDGNHVK
jgi:hypothetical protein